MKWYHNVILIKTITVQAYLPLVQPTPLNFLLNRETKYEGVCLFVFEINWWVSIHQQVSQEKNTAMHGPPPWDSSKLSAEISYELCLYNKEFSKVPWELLCTTPIPLEIYYLIYILILWNKPLSTGQFARVTEDVEKL